MLSGRWEISGGCADDDLPRLTMVSRVKSQGIAGIRGDLNKKAMWG